MNTTLVVLAAGIGSRYGQGIKQLAKMDDNGYTIIDYSIYDAIKAGFNKVVFIIRKDIEEDFKEIIGNRIEKIVEVEYAYQDMDLPKGFESPKDRKKPWGTVDALLSTKNIVKEPFLIINADDYYGKGVFDSLHEFLVTSDKKIDDKLQIAMAGYKLKNTLSDKGAVTRGVSIGNEENKLVDIIETHEIKLEKDGKISSKENLDSDILNLETTVSMNLWASFPEFIDISEDYFIKYLEKNKENLDSCEYVLPEMIGELIKENKADVTILPTNDKWIGITYKEDLVPAQKSFQKMFDQGLYPDNIWEK
ncbi:MAG: sugar phosphate nucleotidyltransferase [Anaerococcus vaginalis]|uniref:nucleotidyltransferase family protein n=1 Tax=Anaerococcus vaginalis TaxID=33037 RepID=UPI00189AAB16|nr:sugar phosphate nucleotidyltransferase [Anaerococcus vaginalis]MDU4378790.1 sugar phosphate nucleotidyltransferase [Anaerococcus vaginalis]MDU5560369.1 sugar phosphate nucleotidyltransferase [Anaerococcus vaginalis]MDU5824604.1 sugar phosphate nucleotidyltransferase [Anaerococcus vaginalis]MDU7142202.1 sugar phosphate nucleotidyltransferase [Anaerococcus vaginalis]